MYIYIYIYIYMYVFMYTYICIRTHSLPHIWQIFFDEIDALAPRRSSGGEGSAAQRVVSQVQCVAVCCSVLQRGAVCCSVLQCVAVCWSVLQCVAVCCSVLQCVAVSYNVLQCDPECCSAYIGRCSALFLQVPSYMIISHK